MNAVDELLLKWANGEVSASEREELSKHYSLEELDLFKEQSSSLGLETSDITSEWDKLKSKRDIGKSSTAFRLLKWMIPILLLSGVAYMYISSLGPDKTLENMTSEPMLIAMEDKTEIMLAPGSKLSYNESKFIGNRKVWIEGRAYFDVRTKGDFAVISADGIVSVLGTTFDVWELGEDQLVVQCYTGRVNVAASGGMEATLEAGQRYENTSGVMNIGDIGGVLKPKWLNNSIVFENTTLSYVYKDLEKYYAIKFVGFVSNLKFNGELPTNNLQKVTEILNAVTSDTYKIENDRVMVSKSE